MKVVIIKTDGPLTRNGGIRKSHLEKIRSISPEIEVRVTTNNSEELNDSLLDAEIVITSRFLQVDLSKTPRLKWIHVVSAGMNDLTENVKKSDILVTNSSGVHPIPISEHVLGFMLMLYRKLNLAVKNQQIKNWSREVEGIQEMAGKTVTIVGLGHIGSRVARLCKAFEMTVYGVVRNPDREEQFVNKLVGEDQLDSLLPESDFVVDCLPATGETKGLFNLDRFKKFKPTCFFINIGRGDTVVEEDLIEALKSGLIAGAGLDVFETEPLPGTSPLWELENVIITPHNSGLTPKYLDRMINIFIENLQYYLTGKPMPNLVDKKLGY
jgi:phosphoglycerate dehydrogenase-like enzyme